MTPALVVRRTAVLLLPWWLRVGADGSREWTAAAGVAVPGGYEARAFDVLTDEAADDRARYAALSAPAHACDAVAGAAGVTVPVTIDGADAWLRAEPGERVRVAARRFAEAHLAAGYKGGGCGSGDQSCVVDRLCEVLREKGGAPPPGGPTHYARLPPPVGLHVTDRADGKVVVEGFEPLPGGAFGSAEASGLLRPGDIITGAAPASAHPFYAAAEAAMAGPATAENVRRALISARGVALWWTRADNAGELDRPAVPPARPDAAALEDVGSLDRLASTSRDSRATSRHGATVVKRAAVFAVRPGVYAAPFEQSFGAVRDGWPLDEARAPKFGRFKSEWAWVGGVGRGPVGFLLHEDAGLGNFAHFFSELIHRVGAFLELKRSDPRVRLAVFADYGLAPYQREALAALGALDDGLVEIAAPTLFDALYVAGPVCAAYSDVACSRATWDRLRAGLGVPASASHQNKTRRFYVRRAVSHRPLLNEAALTRALERRGFEAVDLVPLSLRERVTLLATAAAVVVPTGAAAFNALFLAPSTRLYVVDHPALPQLATWWRVYLASWDVDVRILGCDGVRVWPAAAPHAQSGWPATVGQTYPTVQLPWMLPPDVEVCLGGLFAEEDPVVAR